MPITVGGVFEQIKAAGGVSEQVEVVGGVPEQVNDADDTAREICEKVRVGADQHIHILAHKAFSGEVTYTGRSPETVHFQ